MIRQTSPLLLLVLYAVAARPSFAQLAAIQGSVVDETGKPVSGAFVTATRDAVPAASGQSTTDANGTFSISRIPAGPYSVCAQLPALEFVGSCDWQFPASIDIVANEVNLTPTLVLRRGDVLKVRINDPQRIVETRAGTSQSPRLLVGVIGPMGLFHSAKERKKDSGGYDFDVVVPFDTAVRLVVSANAATLSGADVPPGREINLPIKRDKAQASAPPVTITLSPGQP